MISLLAAMLLLCGTMYGRSGTPYTVTVSILDKSGKPVPGATLLLLQSGLWGISDKNGDIEIKNVPKLPEAYKVSMLGYKDAEGEIGADGKTSVRIFIEEETLMMKEVVVVAQGSHSGESTSSTIGR